MTRKYLWNALWACISVLFVATIVTVMIAYTDDPVFAHDEPSDSEAFATFVVERHEWVTEMGPLLQEFFATAPGQRSQLRFDIENALSELRDWLTEYPVRECFRGYQAIAINEVDAIARYLVATVNDPDNVETMLRIAQNASEVLHKATYGGVLLCSGRNV